jgi:hypothetical protein
MNAKTLILATIAIVAIACHPQTERKNVSGITPNAFTENPELFTIENPSTATKLNLKSGTIIEIPNNAFIYKDGSPVTGTVRLEYKEYKNAVDVLTSGIPMEYDSAGNANVLQTAGMLEINGHDISGKEIYIKPDKALIISMASTVSDDDYNFYAFDSQKNNWNFIQSAPLRKAKSATIKTPTKPIQPKAYDPNGIVIDMNINTQEFPELSTLKGLTWQYAGKNSAENPQTNSWIFAEKWDNIALELIDRDASLFRLHLSGKNKSFKTTITPVLAGKKYERAMQEFKNKMDEYTKKCLERSQKAEAEKSFNESLYRTVGINNFGIYNYDRIFKEENPRIAAQFEINNKKVTEDITIYHLYSEAATVVRYSQDKWKSFALPKSGGNCLVAFIDNKVAVLSNEEYLKLDKTKIEKEGKHTFNLKTTGTALDAEAFRKMMNL